MTLAKVFSKTDRWLGAKVQRRNTERDSGEEEEKKRKLLSEAGRQLASSC